MRVKMLANVGLWEQGQTYDLPDEQAENYIRLEYAKAVEEPKAPAAAEMKPSGATDKPGARRRTKAVEAAPQNKGAASDTSPQGKTGT